MTPKEHLETQQALFKQFAEVLDFVLKFDDLKVTDKDTFQHRWHNFLYFNLFIGIALNSLQKKPK